MQKINLSIIIITHRNDARFLQALQSAQFAQEVLIIDHHSQNDWAKLKSKFNFKVLKWDKKLDDFSALRNWAVKQASFDWIFFLDSDEVIAPASVQAIADIIKQNPDKLIAVKRNDLFAGRELKYGETGHHFLVRMGQKQDILWQRPVHEVIMPLKAILKSQILIYHRAHLSINDFIQDINNYAQLEATSRTSQKLSKTFWQLLTFPIGKFIVNYFFKLGFLDGFAGIVYALIMSLHSLLVRVYLYEKHCEK